MRHLVDIVVTLALAAATSTPMSSAAPIELGAQQATSAPGKLPGRARRANKAPSSCFLVENPDGEVQLATEDELAVMFPGMQPQAVAPLFNGNAPVAPPALHWNNAFHLNSPVHSDSDSERSSIGGLLGGLGSSYPPERYSVWSNPEAEGESEQEYAPRPYSGTWGSDSTYNFSGEGSDDHEVYAPVAGDSPGSSAMHASVGALNCAAAGSNHNQVNSEGPEAYEDEYWGTEASVFHTVQDDDGSHRWSTDGSYKPYKDELRQRRATRSARGTDPVQLVADKGSDWAVALGVGNYDKTTLTKTIVKAGGTHSSVAMISVARGYEVKVIKGKTFSDYSSSDAVVYPAGFWALKLEANHMISVRIIRQFRLKIGDSCLKSTATASGTDNTWQQQYAIGGSYCDQRLDASHPSSCSHCLGGNEDVDWYWGHSYCKRHERHVSFSPVEKSTCSQETDGRPGSENKGLLSELWSYDLDSGRIVHVKSGLCLVASDKNGAFNFQPDYYTQLTLISCDHSFLWSDSLLPTAGSRGSFGRWDLHDVKSGSMLKVRGWRGKNPSCTPDSSDHCDFPKGICADAGAWYEKVHLWDCHVSNGYPTNQNQQWRVSII